MTSIFFCIICSYSSHYITWLREYKLTKLYYFQDENVYTDRESQLRAIEKTFLDVKEPLTHHYSKPGVTAVEELPVFPDFSLWKYPCAQVIFDSDPAPVGRPMPAQLEEMSQAMIR